MNNIESSKGESVMYQPDETIRLEVRMDEETVWLTQQQMAELFQKSVGYRVKSKRGTAFRQWANKVLKDYLLRGYAINQRIAQIEQRTDSRFESQANRISALEDKVNFFVRSSLPPVEGIIKYSKR